MHAGIDTSIPKPTSECIHLGSDALVQTVFQRSANVNCEVLIGYWFWRLFYGGGTGRLPRVKVQQIYFPIIRLKLFKGDE